MFHIIESSIHDIWHIIFNNNEQIQQDNKNVHVNMSQLRASQLQEARAERNQQRQLERRQAHRANDRQRQQVHRAYTSASFLRLAFE